MLIILKMEAFLPTLKLKIKIMFTKFYKLFGKQHENEKFQLRKLNLKVFFTNYRH